MAGMNLLEKLKMLLTGPSEPTMTQAPMMSVPKQEPRPSYPVWRGAINEFYANTLKRESPGWYEGVKDNLESPEVYPMLQEDVMKHMYDKTMEQRPGTEWLLPLQANPESTGGRSGYNSNWNLFGTLKQGEGTDAIPYDSFQESIDSQLGPGVLGGGETKNMNILNTNRRLTGDDINKLYQSYNPNSNYVEGLIEDFNILNDKYNEPYQSTPGQSSTDVKRLMDKYDKYFGR